MSVALRKIRKAKPTTLNQFRSIGLPLQFIKAGVFRKTYRVLNCNLVVKLPLTNDKTAAEGRQHTRTELARIKRLKKHRFMRPYLPRVFYHDKVSGTLVMSYHAPFADHEDQVDALGFLVQTLIKRGTGITCSDLHSENIHQKNDNKQVVLIDLGY